MDEAKLLFKPGVTLSVLNGEVGLLLNGNARFAENARHVCLLRALCAGAQPPETLKTLLRGENAGLADCDASLALAEFILRFDDYLAE